MGKAGCGMTLYVKYGYPTFLYNLFESDITKIKSSKRLPDGTSSLKLVFDYDEGGSGKGATVSLFIKNENVAEGKLKATVPARFGTETFGIGEDSGLPVTHDYKSPFKFKGEIDEVNVKYMY